MTEEAVVERVLVYTQDHVYAGQGEVGSMKLQGWQWLMVVERGVDGDMPLLLLLQGVVLAAAVAVVVAGVMLVMAAAAEADFEAVGVVHAVANAFVAEAEKGEAEWIEPISQSVKHKVNAQYCELVAPKQVVLTKSN